MVTFHRKDRSTWLGAGAACVTIAVGAGWAASRGGLDGDSRASAAIPFALAAPPPAFTGRITDRREAGGYLYVRVDDRWVVTLHKELAPGALVRVSPIGEAASFFSARLQRAFTPLVFAVVKPAAT